MLAFFSSASFAQYGCGPDAAFMNNVCGEGCYSMKVRLTEILEADNARIDANGGKIAIKLTSAEVILINVLCS